MKATLVEITRAIDTSLSGRDGIIKPLFEATAAQNLIVQDVLDRKTTFSKEYERLFGKYNSAKVYLPYSLPKDFKEQAANLEACVGYSQLDPQDNPVSFGLLGTTMVTGITILPTERERREAKYKLDRRKFLSSLGFGVVFGAITSGVGGLAAYDNKRNLEYMKQNAEYLDNVYARVYKNK